MNGWLLAAAVLMVGGLLPALLVAARGPVADRLIGLQLAGGSAVLVVLVLAHGYGQSSYLIVPTVLAVLSVAGVLVFTRLMRSR